MRNLYTRSKSFILFFALYGILLICSIIMNNHLIDNSVFLKSYGGQMSSDRVAKMIDTATKYQLISYFILLLFLFLKILFPYLVIKLGYILTGLKSPSTFITLLKVEFILVLGQVINTAYVLFNNLESFQQINNFYPLSILNFFNIPNDQLWLINPLKGLNAFEVIYWFTLTWLLSRKIQIKYWKSFEFVMSTYGLGFLIWMVFITFLTINLS